MLRKSGIVFITLCLSAFISCKKDAGLGGLATIKGKVYATDVTKSGDVQSAGYIGENRVYISVSGSSTSLTDVRTNYDGSFEFDFLRKGTYDIWTYGNCDTCAWKQEYDIHTKVEITEKKQTVVIDDLQIII